MQSPIILYLLEIVSKKYYSGYAKVLKYYIVLETVKKKSIYKKNNYNNLYL